MNNSSFAPHSATTAGTETETEAGTEELRFGYTLTDLHILAGYAARDCWWAARLPWQERLDVALSALAEHLYSCTEAPTGRQLRTKAWTALSLRLRQELRHHGVDPDTGQIRTGFLRFWNATTTASPEHEIVERQALAQIWQKLPDTLRAALEALAEGELYDDPYGHAAQVLGVPRAVAATRISRARALFLAWWHEHEEPSRLYSRHRPRRAGVPPRPATRSITERERYRRANRTAGTERPMYNRARRVQLPVSDAELARRNDAGATLAELATEYGTTHYTVARRIRDARASTAQAS